MNISDAENQLFERWRERRKNLVLVKDGVADEQAYIASDPKLLFVLKEPNDPHGRLRDLREFIRNARRPQTWNGIARWTIGIRSLPKPTPGKM